MKQRRGSSGLLAVVVVTLLAACSGPALREVPHPSDWTFSSADDGGYSLLAGSRSPQVAYLAPGLPRDEVDELIAALEDGGWTVTSVTRPRPGFRPEASAFVAGEKDGVQVRWSLLSLEGATIATVTTSEGG